MTQHNALALALAAVFAAAPAVAQSINRAPTGPVTGTPEQAVRQPLPRALPGARTDRNAPAPLDRAPSEMKPNEAMFDAINRGDLLAARDAISRGADPDARNILGLTPIDLAVDLGRNEITFLLINLRGTGSAGSTQPARAAAAAVPARPAPRQSVRPPVAASAPSATAPRRQVAGGDPGVPAPQAGFLGFGGNALR